MKKSVDLLRSHFGLTPAEARLALHLVAGETLRCAAVNLSITYETARSQLKSIFNKTKTHRQAELVIVILTALPGRLGAPIDRAPRRLGPKVSHRRRVLRHRRHASSSMALQKS